MSKSANIKLDFWHRSTTVPVILQSEASECGLACIAIILNYHGYNTNLLSLRKRFSVSLKGSTLSEIIDISQELNLIGRAVQLDLEELKDLKAPCILHWDLNHFVVLVKVSGKKITIIDPAVGKVVMSLATVSKHFTGVALELTKDRDFRKAEDKDTLSIYQMIKGIKGIKSNLTVLLLVALIIEILSLFNPFLMQWAIDKVIPFNDENLLTLLIIGFSIVLIVNRILVFFQSWVVLYFSNNLKLELETNIFSTLIDLPLSYFQKRHLGDVVSRFESIHNIQSVFTTQFITAALDGVFAILTLALMLSYSIKLTAIVFITVLLYVIIRWAYYQPLKLLNEEKIILNARKDSHFLESVRGIKSVQFFNKQSQRMSQWLNTYVKEVNIELKSSKLIMVFALLNGLLFGVENLLVIWFGIEYILEETFTVGIFIAFIAYATQFKIKINSLIDNYITYKLLDIDKERLADIVLSDRKVSHTNGYFDVQQIYDNSVTLENVSFSYSQRDILVLENINIHIKSDEFVVITGVSGKGKSTLMNLIAGINQPTSGDILMGSKSILGKKLSNDLVSMVSQDDTLYAGSIMDNICFFDYSADLKWIEECAIMACIHDEIVQMPMGYETLVGDMGTVLSGGQKQRVLIARALYFKPRILLLDEATSHLDVDNERNINNVLKQLPITRIAIAHRLETIKSADRVIEI